MANWWVVRVKAGTDLRGTETGEVLWWRLSELSSGYLADEVRGEDWQLSGWLDGQTPISALEEFREQVLALDASLIVRWEPQDDQDWDNEWKQYVRPRAVGERLFLCPVYHPPDGLGERLLIRTNPGGGFGTGEHATTRLCLVALERLIETGSTVADIGTGCGTLAVAALKLGARLVWAVDIDPIAARSAKEHLALNDLAGQAEVRVGSSEVLDQPVDGIVCNILAEPIIALAQEFRRLAKPGAWGVFSGLLVSQVEWVIAGLATAGWQVEERHEEGDWACLIGHWP